MPVVALYDYLLHTAQYNVEEKVKRVGFEKGHYFYKPGEAQRHIFLLESGAVKIGSYSSEGEEVTYDVLTSGEFFGNLGYLDNVFFEYARAVSEGQVLVFHTSFFKQIIVQDPFASEWFNINVVKRWSKAESRLLHMTRGDIEARLQHLQESLSIEIVNREGQRTTVFDILSQQELADLCGTTRQTIAKKLRQSQSAHTPAAFKHGKKTPPTNP
ncbi:MAG: hypothetical protein OHK0053_34940 [Microscillaceae bacterium]